MLINNEIRTFGQQSTSLPVNIITFGDYIRLQLTDYSTIVLYYKFYEMFKYVNGHYLFKYALICIFSRTDNLNIGWSQVQDSIVDILKVFTKSNFGFLYLWLHKSENTVYSQRGKQLFLGIKCYINQVNVIWTNPSVQTFRIQIGIQECRPWAKNSSPNTNDLYIWVRSF